MINWLTKSTNEYRVETMDEVETFHKNAQKEAEDGGYTLTNFSWTKKEVKKGGEILDEYFICKVSFVFNDPKEPDNPYSHVEYDKSEVLANIIEDREDGEGW